MTLELLDTRFGRSGYPKTVNYTESDIPNRWEYQWKAKGAYNTKYYENETQKDISYTLNSQGYREQEWHEIIWNDCYIFLGCSHTFGVGVEETKTIPALIQQHTDIKCVNLGIPGGTNAFSMFNSTALIQYNIKPKAVFFQKTYKNRWFDVKENCLLPYSVHDKKYRFNFKNQEYINFLDNHIIQTIKSQWKYICPVIDFFIDIIPEHDNFEYIARCGTHYNGKYFEKVVEQLLENA